MPLCSGTVHSSRSGTDWEAIIVNDGSKDDTVARLQRFQNAALVNFRFIDQENAGAAAARDRGIRAASCQRRRDA